MSDDSFDDLNRIFSESAAPKGAKNAKGSVRQKYNRRKAWLAHAIDQMSIAIDDVLSQEDPIYKRAEIETLRNAITKFREETGLKSPAMAGPTQEEMDRFMEMLTNLQPWEPPSVEELAGVYAALGLLSDTDESAGSDESSSAK